MGYLQIQVQETNPLHSRVFFNVPGSASGSQPLASVNGGPYSSVGIGPLLPVSGANSTTYYAQLSNTLLLKPYDIITTFVNVAATNYQGDSVEVVRPSWFSARHAAILGNSYINPASGLIKASRRIIAYPNQLRRD